MSECVAGFVLQDAAAVVEAEKRRSEIRREISDLDNEEACVHRIAEKYGGDVDNALLSTLIRRRTRLNNEMAALLRAEAARLATGDAIPDYMAPFPPEQHARWEKKEKKEEEHEDELARRGVGPTRAEMTPYRDPAPEAPDPTRNLMFERVHEERDRLLVEANAQRKEIATLKQQLIDATVQQQRGLMLEALGDYFSQKDWIPAPVAHAAASDSSLADQILALSRERESIVNARSDADRMPISGAGDLAKKSLVQIVWPEHKGWTILMPLRYALAAAKAAIDVWSQEHMERMKDLEEKTK